MSCCYRFWSPNSLGLEQTQGLTQSTCDADKEQSSTVPPGASPWCCARDVLGSQVPQDGTKWETCPQSHSITAPQLSFQPSGSDEQPRRSCQVRSGLILAHVTHAATSALVTS